MRKSGVALWSTPRIIVDDERGVCDAIDARRRVQRDDETWARRQAQVRQELFRTVPCYELLNTRIRGFNVEEGS